MDKLYSLRLFHLTCLVLSITIFSCESKPINSREYVEELNTLLGEYDENDTRSVQIYAENGGRNKVDIMVKTRSLSTSGNDLLGRQYTMYILEKVVGFKKFKKLMDSAISIRIITYAENTVIESVTFTPLNYKDLLKSYNFDEALFK